MTVGLTVGPIWAMQILAWVMSGALMLGAAASAQTAQALQADDALNPGMLWVLQGKDLWERADGAAQRSCAGCHGAVSSLPMSTAAARHPAWDARTQQPITLSQRIEQCRVRQQGAGSLAWEHPTRLALEAVVAHASRGQPRAPLDPRLASTAALGQQWWNTRLGQLGLSCAHCHDERAGQALGGVPIPAGHAEGYPIYRLEWQSLGTVQRRLRNCQTGVRAQPLAPDSPEAVALEVYLAQRDRARRLHAPGVRP